MAKHHQRSAKWDSSLLELWRRAAHCRWYCLEGNLDTGTTQEMWSYIQTQPWRTSWSWEMQASAMDIVYWPGLNGQHEKMILNCELCLKYAHAKCKPKPTTSLGQEIPVHPWSKLANDIFHFDRAAYLLIADYTSRFLIVCKLTQWQLYMLQINASNCFPNMDGLTLSYLTMVYVTHHKHSQCNAIIQHYSYH